MVRALRTKDPVRTRVRSRRRKRRRRKRRRRRRSSNIRISQSVVSCPLSLSMPVFRKKVGRRARPFFLGLGKGGIRHIGANRFSSTPCLALPLPVTRMANTRRGHPRARPHRRVLAKARPRPGIVCTIVRLGFWCRGGRGPWRRTPNRRRSWRRTPSRRLRARRSRSSRSRPLALIADLVAPLGDPTPALVEAPGDEEPGNEVRECLLASWNKVLEHADDAGGLKSTVLRTRVLVTQPQRECGSSSSSSSNSSGNDSSSSNSSIDRDKDRERDTEIERER